MHQLVSAFARCNLHKHPTHEIYIQWCVNKDSRLQSDWWLKPHKSQMKAMNWAPCDVYTPISEWRIHNRKVVLHKGIGRLISIDVCLNAHIHRQMEAKLKGQRMYWCLKTKPIKHWQVKYATHILMPSLKWCNHHNIVQIYRYYTCKSALLLLNKTWCEQCKFLETPVLSDLFFYSRRFRLST